MAYRHNDALHKHQVRARRLKISSILVLSLVLIGSLIIGVDWIVNQISDTETVVSSENTKSVQAANVSSYRTEYYQFQAPEDWVEIANEAPGERYVYVKNSANDFITQKMTIIIDRPDTDKEADFKLTHVLPVTIDTEGNFIPVDSVSEHCGESFPDNIGRNPARNTHANVSFVCAPDSKQYNIVVGEYDGDESLKVTLSNGKEVSLFIVYSDLTAYPSSGDIYNIISTFEIL